MPCRRPTILQSATARWALRVLSVLSLLSGSRCGGLPIWKMFPADLGRFLRPFDAELMHTHPLTKQPYSTERVLSDPASPHPPPPPPSKLHHFLYTTLPPPPCTWVFTFSSTIHLPLRLLPRVFSPCACLCAFLPASAWGGAGVIPDEPRSAGKVPDERPRLLSALPRLRRGASHLHSSRARCTVEVHTQTQGSR